MKFIRAFISNLKAFWYDITHLKETWLKTKIWYVKTKNKAKIYIKHPNLLWITLRSSWKYVISFLIAWFITNGWAYTFAIIGIGWIKSFAIWYIGFLWLPFTPEKIITFPLSFIIHKWLWQENMSKEIKEVRYQCILLDVATLVMNI